MSDIKAKSIDSLSDLPITLRVEFGSVEASVREILKWRTGKVIALDQLAGAYMSLYMNNTLLAEGEAVVINEKMAIRLLDLVNKKERVKKS